MTTSTNKSVTGTAFTLIELLAVISIIGILAALIVAAGGAARRSANLARARTELSMIQTALESYKAQRGTYPPDNTNNPAAPQLFYELTGTYLTNGSFVRIHGGEALAQLDVPNIFYVGGFINSSAVADQAEARDFLPTLQPSEYYLHPQGTDTVAYLGLPISGPIMVTTTNSGVPTFNPFRYVSTNPTNDPGSYDLWIELLLSGKTNRISNWNPNPEIVQ